MTLEDVIKHCEEIAKEKQEQADSNIQFERNGTKFLYDGEEYKKCCKCAEEHRQLAEWLKELKRYKEYGPCAFCKHNTFEESAPCFRCPAGMSFAENVIAKVVEE